MTNKMPKIKGFHNSLYHIRNSSGFQQSITFVPKVKMHGTNAGIRIDLNGSITAQKRTADIFPGDDNAGFAAFVEEHIKPKLDLHQIAMDIFWPKISTSHVVTIDKAEMPNITIMGEWVGPGVQRGVAISQIEQKVFMPFAVLIDTKTFNGKHRVEFEGTGWEMLCAEMTSACERVHFLHTDWEKSVSINPHCQDRLHAAVDKMNAHTLAAEQECPVTKRIFGVTGVGEGYVYYPVLHGSGIIEKHELELFGFKVKGEKHATNKAGKPARVRSKIPDSAYEFAEFHVTEARLHQGLGEVVPEGAMLENKYLGKLIGWVCKDISDECQTEIEESGLDWKKQLSGVIASTVRNWYFKHMEEQAVSMAVAAE